MHPTRKRSLLSMQRSTERRQRENDAPRLRTVVPRLVSLQIEVVEEASAGSMTHKRHVVVANAPVLFIVPCGDKVCEEGGHDITDEVMKSLEQTEQKAEGEHQCSGHMGENACGRRIRYTVNAEYAQG